MKHPTFTRARSRAARAASFASGASIVALLAAGASGCALTSKAEVVQIRYFSPEQVKPRLTGAGASSAPAAPAPNDALEVRLGRVSSGPNLRERIAFRDAAYELGYYEAWRWTERPETFVRRELGRTLFEEHGLHRVFGGAAPTLDVEVIAFDDLRLKPGRAARVQLKAILGADDGVIWEDTITVDRPVSADKPEIEDVVGAMAIALDAASEEVTNKVQSALAQYRAAHASGSPQTAPGKPEATPTTLRATTSTTAK
jgi:cholesterol transport system auxiliary component